MVVHGQEMETDGAWWLAPGSVKDPSQKNKRGKKKKEKLEK